MSEMEYVELVLHGPEDRAVAFVEGFWRGTRAEGSVWFAGREHVGLESFLERLRDRLSHDTHVILPRGPAEALIRELDDAPTVQLEADEPRAIEYAELPVQFECYSREEARAVRSAVEDELPDGVRLEAYEPTEEKNDDAKGVELYSPVHDFISRGEGRYVGPVAGVIAMARRLTDQSFIHPGHISLHLRQ